MKGTFGTGPPWVGRRRRCHEGAVRDVQRREGHLWDVLGWGGGSAPGAVKVAFTAPNAVKATFTAHAHLGSFRTTVALGAQLG
ncbi:hypothetical protein GCM10010174_16490 [Kutzneria viridogrisea]